MAQDTLDKILAAEKAAADALEKANREAESILNDAKADSAKVLKKAEKAANAEVLKMLEKADKAADALIDDAVQKAATDIKELTKKAEKNEKQAIECVKKQILAH